MALKAAAVPLVVAVVLCLVAPASAQSGGGVDSALQRLEKAAGTPLVVRRSPVTGLATLVSAPRGRAIAVAAPRGAKASERALAFVDSGGAAFGLRGRQDVVVASVTSADEVGMEHVRLQQMHRGVPVRGAELIVHLRGGGVTAVNGKTLAAPAAVGTTPKLAAAAATAAAEALLSQDLGVLGAELSTPSLELLNAGFLQGRLTATRLAWFIEARGFALRQLIWVDAQDGSIALHFSQLAEARQRQVHDAGGGPTLPGALVRSEGGGATGDTDADRAYDYSGDTYDYYAAQHGRDSYDDAGATLISSVHYCPGGCPYANAFWDGTQMAYGDGFSAADDVAAHELTHAVTEHSAGLIYCLQSGALNESFSDIFGETVDLTNGGGTDTPASRWYLGEDVPGFGAIRNMMDPTLFGNPGKVSDPAFFCASSCFDFDNGGVHINSGVPNHAYALMVDGGTYNGFTISGIGLTKAGKIQYRALTRYLTAGADLADDYTALQLACADLIGVAGITAANCTNVLKALDAVEMGVPACVPVCGDGLTIAPEECDDGGAVDGDGCDSNCTLTRCGNGIRTGGEPCDDGNAVNGDGCDSNCTLTACGNGIASGSEQCDDGNPIAGDGCEPSCTLSAGCVVYSATDLPQPIPDLGTTVSVLTVPPVGLIGDLAVVDLRGTHTFVGDLQFSLIPPTGPSLLIVNHVCGAARDFDLDLADDAGSAMPCPATDSASHRPSTPLSAFDGLAAGGTWTLRVEDQAGFDSGTLNGWGLRICAQTPVCPTSPSDDCRTAQKSLLLMRDQGGAENRLLWKWIKGQSTSQLELGDPTTRTSYRLCLYAGAGNGLISEALVPPDPLHWAPISDQGFRYRNPLGGSDGVTTILAKGSDHDKSKALVKGRGLALPMPALGLPLPITVQLRTTGGVCLSSTFTSAQVNDTTQLKATAQ